MSDGQQKYELTNSQKWWISVAVGLLAALIFSPFVFGVTNSIFGHTYNCGGATPWGIILHTIVFILLLRLIMW